jgi:hypothetical protein
MRRSKPEQSLERRGRRLPPIVTKHEFIQINLKLVAADTVVSPEQPLLEITNCPIRQRHHGLRAFWQFSSQWLDASHMVEAGLFQNR